MTVKPKSNKNYKALAITLRSEVNALRKKLDEYKKSLKESSDITEPLLIQRNRHYRTALAIRKTFKEILRQLEKDIAETKREVK